MVQGSGDEDMWSKWRWVQFCVLGWFSKCIPLDGSSVTLIARSYLVDSLVDGCCFSAMLSVFWMVDNNDAERETSIKVEVKRLDHGDTACLSLWNIKELTPELATLPLQAVQVSLANVSGSLLIM